MSTETGVSGIGSLDSGVKMLESWSTGVDKGEISSQGSSPRTFSCFSLSGKAKEAGRGVISLVQHPTLPHHRQWLCPSLRDYGTVYKAKRGLSDLHIT